MNEEEKKELIRKLHTLQDSYIEEGYQGFAGVIHETINLLEKQDKEIEKLKTKNNDLLKKLRNRTKDVKKLQKYGVYKKEFATLNKRIEKQEKMIDAMAKFIDEVQGCCPFENEELPVDCEEKCKLGIEPKCWIEYFEKEVRE